MCKQSKKTQQAKMQQKKPQVHISQHCYDRDHYKNKLICNNEAQKGT